MAMVDVKNLAQLPRVAEMTGIDLNLLYTWQRREHIRPVRESLTVFDWTKIRPILAERTGNPPDHWADLTP